MSANNQTLVIKHKGRWYVFTDVNAESWGWNEKNKKPAPNKLSISKAAGVFQNMDEAYQFALKIDKGGYLGQTEYGVQFNYLVKDGAKVKIIK